MSDRRASCGRPACSSAARAPALVDVSDTPAIADLGARRQLSADRARCGGSCVEHRTAANNTADMAGVRLSDALKTLIAAPHAQGNVLPAPSQAVRTALFEGLASSAQRHGLGTPAWLTLGVRSTSVSR